MLRTALEYEKRGFSVIPIAEGDKKPIIKWQPYQQKRATPEELAQWWVKNPRANIGIVTGKISNLFVVDIDTEEGQENISNYIPDSIVTPTANTPRGGQHLYFKYPEGQNITIGAGKIKGTDFRGENGFVLAPPSVNGTGKPYEWVINLDTELAALPNSYIIKIISTIYPLQKNENSEKELLQSVTLCFDQGMRDESIFHVAHTLIKGGAKQADVSVVLNILAKSCNPPFPENEVDIKIKSALERAARKERNISREVEEFIAVTSGYFPVTSCYSLLQCVTGKEKTAVRVSLNRLKDKGIIEKHQTQDGVYRRAENEFEFITFDDDEKEELPFPVKMPFDLPDLVEISEGNIILVAGEFNAGKTAFLMNILRMNKGTLPIRYISSEMSKSEFKKRFRGYGLPLDFWKQDNMTDYVKKSFDFHTALKPDGINIIDYLEFKDSDYTKGAEYMTQIHDKLGKGIAIIAVQKKENQRMPRSGDMLLEKPRLAIGFSKVSDSSENPQGWCEILKAKVPRLGKMDGKRLRYEITNFGSRFHTLNDWGFYRI